jgi:hypothetical protein
MFTYSMVLTTPWTLGVYMVRSYLGLHIHPGRDDDSGALLVHSPIAKSSTAAGLVSNDLHAVPEATLAAGDAGASLRSKAEKEALVGERAGLLSASFSLAQV